MKTTTREDNKHIWFPQVYILALVNTHSSVFRDKLHYSEVTLQKVTMRTTKTRKMKMTKKGKVITLLKIKSVSEI